VLVDVLDLLPGLLLVNLALQFGELFAQFGYLPVFFFKLNACVLALLEEHGNEFCPGQRLQSRLVRAVLSIAFHGEGCHVVSPLPPP